MKIINDIAYANDSERQKLDIYLPEGNVSSAFLYFHGGGFVSGDKSTGGVFARYLTQRGIAVISANYRIYPKCKFPDFIYDGASAVAWSLKYIRDELGCEKLYIGGSSAGGHLTMQLCFDKKYLESVGIDNSCVAGYFHDAGQPTVHFNVLGEIGLDTRRIVVDEKAPLYYVGTEKHYPPMRFIVSDGDMPNRYEQTMMMLKTLSHFNYSKYDHKVMYGAHCEYIGKMDEDGETVFGQMVYDFISDVEQ